MNIRFDHIMIHTTDTEKSVRFYKNVFELDVDNTDPYPDFKLTYMINKQTNIKFELREVFGLGVQPIGNVVGHFAFYVSCANTIAERCSSEFPELYSKMEIHVSKKHRKTYKIFTVVSPEGVELSALQKIPL